MALVHERLYESVDLAWIDFDEYVRTLADHLVQSYGASPYALRLQVDVHDVFLGIDTAIPCGLIIHELVSNALKHAFPHRTRGEIRIGLANRGGQLVLKVSDDGVGFPKEMDFRTSRSMGLQLVNTLVDQLEGTIDMRTGKGTEFEVIFDEFRERGQSQGSSAQAAGRG
jgi:two-component sensor histidine kinase